MRRFLAASGAALVLLTASLTAASPASAVGFLDNTAPPPDDRIVIDLVAMAGSGCQPGTADVAVSPDNTAFTVIYSDYLVQTGPGVPITAGRRNCQLNVLVNVPPGFTFAIAKVDHRGYALLEEGANAMQRSLYYFQGMSAGSFVTHPLAAPMDDNWMVTDEVPIASMVWHPCGALRNLNINTELRVRAGSSEGESFVTMDSTDGSIATTYHFAWQRCPVE